jgi:hypothetical protein
LAASAIRSVGIGTRLSHGRSDPASAEQHMIHVTRMLRVVEHRDQIRHIAARPEPNRPLGRCAVPKPRVIQ